MEQKPDVQTAGARGQLSPVGHLPASEAQKLARSLWYFESEVRLIADASQSLQQASSAMPTATVTQSAFVLHAWSYTLGSSVSFCAHASTSASADASSNGGRAARMRR